MMDVPETKKSSLNVQLAASQTLPRSKGEIIMNAIINYIQDNERKVNFISCVFIAFSMFLLVLEAGTLLYYEYPREWAPKYLSEACDDRAWMSRNSKDISFFGLETGQFFSDDGQDEVSNVVVTPTDGGKEVSVQSFSLSRGRNQYHFVLMDNGVVKPL